MRPSVPAASLQRFYFNWLKGVVRMAGMSYPQGIEASQIFGKVK